MNKIATFEKVSFNEFRKAAFDVLDNGDIHWDDYAIEEIYDNIKLPIRSTSGAAGYDFFNPFPYVKVTNSDRILIPTGIKCNIDDGWVLALFPRSSYGIHNTFMLSNTVGIIDSDYYNNKRNEGHIMVSCGLAANKRIDPLELATGDRFCQGIFLQFGITTNDECNAQRTGGIGSTGK